MVGHLGVVPSTSFPPLGPVAGVVPEALFWHEQTNSYYSQGTCGRRKVNCFFTNVVYLKGRTRSVMRYLVGWPQYVVAVLSNHALEGFYVSFSPLWRECEMPS